MANLKVVDAEQLEADLTSVADKIRAKTGGEEKLAFPSGFENALDTIQSADSALAEVEYLLTKGYTDYSDLLYNKGTISRVPVEILRHIENATTIKSLFGYTYIAEIPSLNTSNAIDVSGAFYKCTATVTIYGIDFSRATNAGSAFGNCSKLENITFNGIIKAPNLDLSYCTLLTRDSLMSAINALYDRASEGSTSTYTLTLGSANLAKLTEDEQYIATSKGWTLS